MTKYSYTTIESYFTKNTNSSVDKIKYLIYYFESWTQTLYNKTFIQEDIKFKAKNNDLAIDLTETNNKEITEFNKDALFVLNSVIQTYGDKTSNELKVLIKSEYPYIKAQKINKDNIIKKEDIREYYRSISEIKDVKKLDK